MAKLKKLSSLKLLVKSLRRAGKRIIFANGCFDILHYGHLSYLQAARNLGDFLIVAINSDKSARRLKGKGRPIVPELERAELVSAFSCVDAVTIFDELNCERLLLELEPDVHAKGTDYTKDSVPEAEIVKRYGGKVVITGNAKQNSSSLIISKILGTK